MTRFANTLTKLCEALAIAVWEGLKHLPYKSAYLWTSFVNCISASFIFAHKPPQFIAHYLSQNSWPLWTQRHFVLPEYAGFRTWLYLGVTAVLYPLIVGGICKMRLMPFQKKIDILKLGGEDNRPRILSVRHDDDLRTILRVRAFGIGVEKFHGRKGDLQAAFNQTVESISADENAPQYLEIVLSVRLNNSWVNLSLK